MSAFLDAVLTGFAQPQKVVPARFLYDERGSELFEAITQLPEYYPTRTEVALLSAHGIEIAGLVAATCAVVEFGSGSSLKTPLLLRPLSPRCYLPVDISAEFLADAAASIAAAFPALDVRPIAADFTHPIPLPTDLGDCRMLGFFPGSTIGNLTPADAVDLLRAFRATLGAGSALVIGIDLRKDPAILGRAYDDSLGITAAFNRNLITRINRELGGTLDLTGFAHRARWNEMGGRMEMHLEALRPLRFAVADHAFAMAKGETIHTENSHKYFIEEARFLGRAGGWSPIRHWIDADGLYSLHLWRAGQTDLEP